jgi:hypothetical protein
MPAIVDSWVVKQLMTQPLAHIKKTQMVKQIVPLIAMTKWYICLAFTALPSPTAFPTKTEQDLENPI